LYFIREIASRAPTSIFSCQSLTNLKQASCQSYVLLSQDMTISTLALNSVADRYR